VVLEAADAFAALSFRNLRRVAVVSVENVGVTDLVGAASLLLSEGALEALAERAGSTRNGEKAKA
jgi:large subunit ribosomal protein L4